MISNEERSAQIYLDLYEMLASKADYLQPDKGEVADPSSPETASFHDGDRERWSLPEVVLTAFVTTVVVAFLNGFFGQLGQDLFATLKNAFAGDKKLTTCETKDLVDHLARLLPDLEATPERFVIAEETVTRKLVELRLSEAESQVIAKKTTEIIKTRIG